MPSIAFSYESRSELMPCMTLMTVRAPPTTAYKLPQTWSSFVFVYSLFSPLQGHPSCSTKTLTQTLVTSSYCHVYPISIRKDTSTLTWSAPSHLASFISHIIEYTLPLQLQLFSTSVSRTMCSFKGTIHACGHRGDSCDLLKYCREVIRQLHYIDPQDPYGFNRNSICPPARNNTLLEYEQGACSNCRIQMMTRQEREQRWRYMGTNGSYT